MSYLSVFSNKQDLAMKLHDTCYKIVIWWKSQMLSIFALTSPSVHDVFERYSLNLCTRVLHTHLEGWAPGEITLLRFLAYNIYANIWPTFSEKSWLTKKKQEHTPVPQQMRFLHGHGEDVWKIWRSKQLRSLQKEKKKKSAKIHDLDRENDVDTRPGIAF